MSSAVGKWFDASMSRKISALSTILLSFIFIVVVYSIIKLQQISAEMREVAEIDIPLTRVISEIEILQLEQHILFEKLRVLKQSTPESSDVEEQKNAIQKELAKHSQLIDEQVLSAGKVIEEGVAKGVIVEKVGEHLNVLSELESYQRARRVFVENVVPEFMLLAPGNSPSSSSSSFEKSLSDLDERSKTLLLRLENLTEEIAKHAEKHQEEFLLVNTALGISAFVIGIHVTIYVIASFRRRMRGIEGQIDRAQNALNLRRSANSDGSINDFSDLSAQIEDLISKFSNELEDRQQIESELLKLATTDKLTGAFNRHKWNEVLDTELDYAQKNENPLSLLMIDLDHFKSINDTHGHDVGDQVLMAAAQLIRTNVREKDRLFRLGGEEFAMLFQGYDEQKASAVAEHLRNVFNTNSESDLPQFTASFGISIYRQGDDESSLLKRADEALYVAKQSGRNQVRVA